jgi:hypothetical protein
VWLPPPGGLSPQNSPFARAFAGSSHAFCCYILGSLVCVFHSGRILSLFAPLFTCSLVFCVDSGVCGLGPATLLLRRMNGMLRNGLSGNNPEPMDAGKSCVLVQRKDGGGREIENHDDLLDALNLMHSVCHGRWQVVYISFFGCLPFLSECFSSFCSTELYVYYSVVRWCRQ